MVGNISNGVAQNLMSKFGIDSTQAGGIVQSLIPTVIGAYVGVQTFLRPMALEAVIADPRSPDIWRTQDVTSRLLTLGSGSVYLTARENPTRTIIKRATHDPFGAGLGRTGSSLGTIR